MMKTKKLLNAIKDDFNIDVPDYWNKINQADYSSVPPMPELTISKPSNVKFAISLTSGIGAAVIFIAGIFFAYKQSIGVPPVLSQSGTSKNAAYYSSRGIDSSPELNSSSGSDVFSEISTPESKSVPQAGSEDDNNDPSNKITMLKLPRGLQSLTYNQAKENEFIRDKIPDVISDYAYTVFYSGDYQSIYTCLSKTDADGMLKSEIIILCQKYEDDSVREYTRDSKNDVKNDSKKYSDGQTVSVKKGQYIFRCCGRNIMLDEFAEIVCSLY